MCPHCLTSVCVCWRASHSLCVGVCVCVLCATCVSLGHGSGNKTELRVLHVWGCSWFQPLPSVSLSPMFLCFCVPVRVCVYLWHSVCVCVPDCVSACVRLPLRCCACERYWSSSANNRCLSRASRVRWCSVSRRPRAGGRTHKAYKRNKDKDW